MLQNFSASTASQKQLQKLLREVFGLRKLRPSQAEIVQRVLSGTSTLGILPTGAGKSLCYQLPALMLPGRTLVVSPLIALMKDQTDRLLAHGIRVAQVNSALPAAELSQALESVADGSARVILTTPEQLANPEFITLLSAHPVSLVAVDEAHCIVQWGHDFRPAFLDIHLAIAALGNPTVLALTATASGEVTREVTKRLGIADRDVVQTSSFRPNLRMAVAQADSEHDKRAKAIAIVAASPGSGIVYTSTVNAAQQLHEALLAAGQEAGLYHGRLGAAARAQAQDAFMSGRTRVMVATNAFGLGIDKADIRFVLHYQLPPSLDAYYQEAGRAGRDGEPAQCTLLYHRKDKSVQQFFLAGRYPGPMDIDAVYQHVPSRGDKPATADQIVHACGRSEDKARVALSLLRSEGVVAARRDGGLTRKREGLRNDEFEALLTAYSKRRDHDRAMLESMAAYAQSGGCRWQALLAHLDSGVSPPRCGQCDSCERVAQAQVAALAPSLAAGSASAPWVPPVPSASAVTSSPRAASSTITLATDDAVTVKRYGRGVVTRIDTDSVTVKFPGGETRTFLPDFVKRARRSAVQAATRT
ncbi:MAG: RecQ family ATP-dependent DNA helicase [Comamonadaceae bacterium]|nr:MAG: RecQ family ATP-dependent DNA helicase [Comamonadaceae bacterium]